MKCIYCSGECIKTGKKRGIQRYRCKHCGKTQQEHYSKPRISEDKQKWVKKLTCEGCGIGSIGRLLQISKSSVQRIIKHIASRITIPELKEKDQQYEIDELRTYCGNKNNELWVIYAINKHSGQVVDYCVGRRTKENVKKVVESVLKLNPRKIYTDGLNIYGTLLSKSIHRVFRYCTNKIERYNLILRSQLKRLSRKTIFALIFWYFCIKTKVRKRENTIHITYPVLRRRIAIG